VGVFLEYEKLFLGLLHGKKFEKLYSKHKFFFPRISLQSRVRKYASSSIERFYRISAIRLIVRVSVAPF
jgi:hypothetical protein